MHFRQKKKANLKQDTTFQKSSYVKVLELKHFNFNTHVSYEGPCHFYTKFYTYSHFSLSITKI